jgi:hypothetical protein
MDSLIGNAFSALRTAIVLVDAFVDHEIPDEAAAVFMEPIKSHQIHDFCDHNDKLVWYYNGKLYCDECVPNTEERIKIFNNEYECAICRDATYLDIIYNCGHMFCQDCVNNLEKSSTDCPICRK